MPIPSKPHRRTLPEAALPLLAFLGLGGCAAVGSVMSPYPEKFGCKNSDHGVCIHPEQAYEDAVAGRTSKSDPAVTNDKKLLRKQGTGAASRDVKTGHGKPVAAVAAYPGYRDSVYRELQGLIDQPVTPMLKPPRAIRTLILPYVDRQRPDRLYMPRYVYSLLDRPEWVVGDYLVDPIAPSSQAPVLGQVQEKPADEPASMPAHAAGEPHP